ncbi:hypothetical protein [Longimicrobium terrae]|uniref:Uncharacterized protein n=1 Tax=Longimicrobium terrae TaxID=1639882 RepID=A0A841H0W7_9BACT|nr:hypothetical protein [Longimicrobium terrae]MBB4637337.1 hypothetical protein [Longimicrobium terrae]MBB6071735.1 hypothetical protein [Longimicrobium terrae]NNC28496.1 hypothetical protein [Longimicrobium terrae]
MLLQRTGEKEQGADPSGAPVIQSASGSERARVGSPEDRTPLLPVQIIVHDPTPIPEPARKEQGIAESITHPDSWTGRITLVAFEILLLLVISVLIGTIVRRSAYFLFGQKDGKPKPDWRVPPPLDFSIGKDGLVWRARQEVNDALDGQRDAQIGRITTAVDELRSKHDTLMSDTSSLGAGLAKDIDALRKRIERLEEVRNGGTNHV